MILAIDTSNDEGSICLSVEDAVLAELVWRAERNHSAHLPVSLSTVLELGGSQMSELTSVVVATGPGSFSGLRVGISAGKGLAMALDIPLVGICTLDILALQASDLPRRVCAFLPAGREQLYMATYDVSPTHFRRDTEPCIVSISEAQSVAESMNLCVGSGTNQLSREKLRILPSLWRMRRSSFLAELGRRYFQTGGTTQLHELEPLYLRRSAAEEKRFQE